jgi:aspartokinase
MELAKIRPELARDVSINRAVKEEVDSDFSMQDAIARGYVNISALSRLLVPSVARRMKVRIKDVQEVAVASALKRLRGAYSAASPDVARVIGASIVNVRTHVSRLSVEKTKKTLQTVSSLLSDHQEDFIQVSESLSSITLIFDQRLHKKVRRALSGGEILDEGEECAALTVHSPDTIMNTPGCVSVFYDQLSRKDVNVEDTVSCYTDTIMVVSMKDASRAFEALTELIGEEQRKLEES